jgi:hypothetical protein
MKITPKDLSGKLLNRFKQKNEKVSRYCRYRVINAGIGTFCPTPSHLETIKESLVGEPDGWNGLVGSTNARSTLDRIDFHSDSDGKREVDSSQAPFKPFVPHF